jgi:hypothetical protein
MMSDKTYGWVMFGIGAICGFLFACIVVTVVAFLKL